MQPKTASSAGVRRSKGCRPTASPAGGPFLRGSCVPGAPLAGWLNRDHGAHRHTPNFQIDAVIDVKSSLGQAGRTIDRPAIDDVRKMTVHPNVNLFQGAGVLTG